MADHVLIVGAGVAGLSAAAVLRALGQQVTLVEAADRIGGRAHTVQLGAHAFDRGASWLHHGERNALADVARRHGDVLMDADAARTRRVLVDNRVATPAELADRAVAWKNFESIAAAAPHGMSLADAIASLRHDPWIASIEAWEACQIAAADPRDLSVQDWEANLLEGSNLTVQGGIGTFVTRRLAGPASLHTPVTSIDWSGPITAETPRGTIHADACIVTVSIAALSRIRFIPALPHATDGLQMGLLTKVALRATGPDRLGLVADESVSQRIVRDAPMMTLLAWPGGADHVVAFIGGQPAWELSRLGEAATVDFVRTQLRSWFGVAADRAFGEAVTADWARDRWHGGAYAYARPGHAGDRGKLALPLAEGMLVMAGEAYCSDGLAGTVGGAWLEGQRAATAVSRWLSARVLRKTPS